MRNFFSRPQNLAAITPENLSFKMISNHHGEVMYQGQIIEYIVKPVMHIPVRWLTEITTMKKHEYFIDEQRSGPYALWHHQHHFKEIKNGIEMTDIVHYKIPFGWFGDLAQTLFVHKKLRNIFSFRYQKIIEMYGVYTA